MMPPLGKVAVLGLDGVPFSLLKHFMDAGVMPRLAETAVAGTFLRMTSTLPPISSVAWTSFMTGRNPGEHGIFGFTDLKNDQIALHLPSFDDIRCPTVWQLAPHRRSVVVNLPFTYPARPLNGVLIAGFVAPLFERAVYPDTLIPWLRSMSYRIDVDAVKARHDRDGLVLDLFDTLNRHEEAMLTLMDHERWDLFIAVVTGTDRLHHFFFDAAYDPANPRHDDFIAYYRRVDSLFGRVADRLGPADRLIALSDHGFTCLKTQVYLNHLLKSMGYLSFTRPSPTGLEDIHPASRAFALDPGRIYLNTRDRFRNGVLSATDARALRTSLRNDLLAVRLMDVGIREPAGPDRLEDRLFPEVRTAEEVYQGACFSLAPDLVAIPRNGYDVKAALNAPGPVMTDIFTGMHTHDDAFLIVNDPTVAERLPEPNITDVAALVLEVV